ncbi:hypothetical protein E2C01_045208 [Portunus trituberculatus]|uniref:Uncharacterized protein n=1 Tax=Portunus trituberculatus TaxID=210409 RepID=A0A5B7G4E3_PORTR|nr:hypothetical protein [Portunus trituberculatus]
MWGSVMVNISMGSMLKGLPVFVTTLVDPCLLGVIDFLMHVGGSLDLQEEKLKVRGQEVPLILGGEAQCERSKQQGGVSCQEPGPGHGQDDDESDAESC